MTNNMTQKPPQTDIRLENLSDAEVADYLRANPDFFKHYPHLLTEVTPPEFNHGQGVADFQHFMLRQLKTDREHGLAERQKIVETTRANMNIQNRVHTVVLCLLEAKNFEEFLQTITQDMAFLLDVDVVTMIIESQDNNIAQTHNTGVMIKGPGVVDKWLGQQDHDLQGHIDGSPEIFGPMANMVHSQALLKLKFGREKPLGILAFGSRNPTLFEKNQGTDLINFLARVIERCIRKWLDLPPQTS